MQAYDIELLKYSTPAPGEEVQGWCFGLPPGISPEQWPLDPDTGYPLMHGFTLKLPDDYRVHGPEIVALSFFSLAPDQNDGGPESVDGISEQVVSPAEQPPVDVHLLPFWQAGRASHPRLHRMEDILGGAYAVILLTEAEFQGPACPPPQLPANNPLLAQTTMPRWLVMGSGAFYCMGNGLQKGDFLYLPEGLDQRCLLRWTSRPNDPNAGKEPSEFVDTGYQLPYYWENDVIDSDNYREHTWVQGHQSNHIGGTMQPVQGIPDMSPYYVEFGECFGGYNFGGGNAQLDFRDMKFDWAC